MMINVVYALGELAILFPISGGFYTYSVRFIDPSWGFAMGWNYVFQWVSDQLLIRNNETALISFPGYRPSPRTRRRRSHSPMVARCV
jgi:L-asparagine transporter-like permease